MGCFQSKHKEAKEKAEEKAEEKASAPEAGAVTKTILVTGASGNVGKPTLAALGKLTDVKVKAGVRDPAKSADLASVASNVTVVAADPLKPEEIAEALKDVDSVFVITPPHIDRAKITIASVDAAKAAGAKFVLVISVATAELTDTIFGKQCTEIETHVQGAGVPYAILRLPFFLDNQYGNIGSIKGQSTWYDAIEPEKPYTPVAIQDVAEVAAKILSNPEPHSGKIYLLAAPADTNANLATYYTEAVGKPVTYTAVPYEGVKSALVGLGFEDWQVDGILELEKLINGDSPVVNDPSGAKTIEEILGRPATTFKAFVEGAAPAFKE